MHVPSSSQPGAVEPYRPDGVPARPVRARLRLATVGGIAAIAILGGGIAAAASAGAPAGGAAIAAATGTSAPSEVTSPLVPTTGAGSAAPAAPPTAAPGAPGTAAPGTDAPAPPAPKVHQPHLGGTVTSVSGSTVLIKDHDGFSRTIVVSSKTTYQDGLTAALAVGTKIHAEGTVAANGTSLDATVIRADKGPAVGGPGRGPGDRGPGGPGGKHAGPPTGAGAPTPPTAPGGGTAVPAPPAATGTAPSASAPATTK